MNSWIKNAVFNTELKNELYLNINFVVFGILDPRKRTECLALDARRDGLRAKKKPVRRVPGGLLCCAGSVAFKDIQFIQCLGSRQEFVRCLVQSFNDLPQQRVV